MPAFTFTTFYNRPQCLYLPHLRLQITAILNNILELKAACTDEGLFNYMTQRENHVREALTNLDAILNFINSMDCTNTPSSLPPTSCLPSHRCYYDTSTTINNVLAGNMRPLVLANPEQVDPAYRDDPCAGLAFPCDRNYQAGISIPDINRARAAFPSVLLPSSGPFPPAPLDLSVTVQRLHDAANQRPLRGQEQSTAEIQENKRMAIFHTFSRGVSLSPPSTTSSPLPSDTSSADTSSPTSSFISHLLSPSRSEIAPTPEPSSAETSLEEPINDGDIHGDLLQHEIFFSDDSQ